MALKNSQSGHRQKNGFENRYAAARAHYVNDEGQMWPTGCAIIVTIESCNAPARLMKQINTKAGNMRHRATAGSQARSYARISRVLSLADTLVMS